MKGKVRVVFCVILVCLLVVSLMGCSETENQLPNTSLVEKGEGFILSYDMAGGEGGEIANLRYSTGESVVIPKIKATKKGCQFSYWWDGDKKYNSGDRFTMPNFDMTLTAVWKSAVSESDTESNKLGTPILSVSNGQVIWDSEDEATYELFMGNISRGEVTSPYTPTFKGIHKIQVMAKPKSDSKLLESDMSEPIEIAKTLEKGENIATTSKLYILDSIRVYGDVGISSTASDFQLVKGSNNGKITTSELFAFDGEKSTVTQNVPITAGGIAIVTSSGNFTQNADLVATNDEYGIAILQGELVSNANIQSEFLYLINENSTNSTLEIAKGNDLESLPNIIMGKNSMLNIFAKVENEIPLIVTDNSSRININENVTLAVGSESTASANIVAENQGIIIANNSLISQKIKKSQSGTETILASKSAVKTTNNDYFEGLNMVYIEDIVAYDKEYDGTKNVELSSNVFDFQGEKVNVTAEFLSGDVGINKKILVKLDKSVIGDNYISTYEMRANLFPRTIVLQDYSTVIQGEKQYDGSKDIMVAESGIISNLVEGDDVSIIATATVENKNAGFDKVATVTYKISGSDSDNYFPPQEAFTTVNILKRNIGFSGLKAVDRPYDTTNVVEIQGGKLVGVVQGDYVTCEIPRKVEISSGNASEVPYDVVADFSLVGEDALNYNLIEPTLKVTISKAMYLSVFHPQVEVEMVSGMTLDDVTLSEGFYFENPSELLRVGTQSYNAYYNLNDGNHLNTPLTISVKVVE